jgi:hypothetical protein
MYNGADRARQVNEIERLAADAVENTKATIEDFGGDWATLAIELALLALDGIDLPIWWGEHDTHLLENLILAGLGYEGD